MEKRYTALRVIATIYKILGVLIAILVLLGIILLVVAGVASQNRLAMYGINSTELMVLAGVGLLFGGGMLALGTFAVGDLLYLVINIEENTRYSAILMRDRQPQ